MKRRTFISLMSVMAAAGVLTLSGCSNSSGSTAASGTAASVAPAAGDQLSNIQSSGKLIVALEGAWQPWSYHDESDTLVGYDVEVSRAIAEKLGVEPEYVESDWDSLFAGLDAGRYDIVCNGVEVTDERAKTYDFTEPYGYIHTALAVRKDNDEITSFEDLKGKTTANSLASTYMELAESYGATVQGIDTLEETIQLLTAGRIDATLNADVSFYILPLCFIHSRFHHLMRYGVGKENEQVRGPHLLVHAGRHLCKYLCLAFIVLTDLHILTDHPVMSSYNYNTHENGTSCSFILLISFQVPQVFLLLHHPEHHSR
mgnify:CR=1 FL=1